MFMSRHPRFMTRATEHMSRRLHDAHVRKALQDKVLQTRAELEEANRQKDLEQQRFEEGIMVNDALRWDKDQEKAAQRKHNANFLLTQIEQRRQDERQQREAARGHHAGYWGPEEKPPQNPEVNREHCADLIKQMEVDQHRKLNDRGQRLRQERQLIDNCVAEMSQDRLKDREKQRAHREVLTT